MVPQRSQMVPRGPKTVNFLRPPYRFLTFKLCCEILKIEVVQNICCGGEGEFRGANPPQHATTLGLPFEKLSGDRPQEVIGGPAARSYRFWGPLGTIWDLWGPSGDHHSKKLSILVIFDQHIYFLAKKCTFKILGCHFPPGFFAEGRRRLANKLENCFPCYFPKPMCPVLIPQKTCPI